MFTAPGDPGTSGAPKTLAYGTYKKVKLLMDDDV